MILLQKSIYLTFFMLMPISTFFIFQSASKEPFVVFIPWEALCEIGGGFVLVFLWLEFLACLVFMILKKTYHHFYTNIVLLIIGIVMCSYLVIAPLGYVNDIQKYFSKKNNIQ
ncbi:MAG: hypothetical protein HQK52_04465 [Oligoflexia bacterium]|nr:hypothetical protein [Oligoflexia bacterium]